MRANEFTTSLGLEYQRLYTQYYKRAHLQARKQGLTGRDADDFARRALEKYKDRIRTGEYNPITGKKGSGRAEYSVNEDQQLSDLTWYHGTNQEFSKPVNSGMWLTRHKEDAEYYADELGHGDGGFYTVTLHPHKSQFQTDLNTVDWKALHDSGVQSIHNESDMVVIDPAIIKTMKWEWTNR